MPHPELIESHHVKALLPEGFWLFRYIRDGGQARVDLVKNKDGLEYAAKTVRTEDFHQIERTVLEDPDFKHYNIINLHSSNSNKTHVQLILSYAEEGELFEVYQKLSRTERIQILLQMVYALQQCHINGLVHGDLKLENFLLFKRDSLRILLTDFGLSFRPPFPRTCATGTTEFLSPEMVSGDWDKVSYPCDLWSLGAVAHELLYETCPFGYAVDSYHKWKVIDRIREGKYLLPKEDPLVGDFISRLLILDQTKRMTLIGCLDHPLLITPGRKRAREVIKTMSLEGKRLE